MASASCVAPISRPTERSASGYLLGVRLAVAALVILPAVGFADRVITVPTGRKLSFGTVRLEYNSQLNDRRRNEWSLGVGATDSIELEIRNRSSRDRDGEGFTTLDFGYNLLTPIPDTSPGITVGVQDLLDATEIGRRGYLALTYRISYDSFDAESTAEFTLGGFFGKSATPYIGISVPLSKRFRLLADHNGEALSGGLELMLVKEISVRYFAEGKHTFLGISAAKRF